MRYLFIDLENSYIIKYEYYEGSNDKELNKIQTETYSYEFNSVTDDNILKFDINNYPDYQYIGEQQKKELQQRQFNLFILFQKKKREKMKKIKYLSKNTKKLTEIRLFKLLQKK